jgi:LPXTG-motif cell wall-anchored protein
MISDIENATVTLTTINENAEIFSKTTTPSAIGGNLKSIVGDKETYGVGDTITYQIQFYAVNIDNTVPDTQQAQITEYIVADSLPDFLDDPTVTSVEIAQSGKTTIQLLDNPDTPRKFVKNEDRVDECKWEYSIPWAYKDESDKEGKLFAIYSKDAIVTLTYTATVNENITNTSAKKNNAKVTHKVSGESLLPPLEGDVDTETGIYGIQKVDEDGVGLGGAVFTIKGLTVLDVYSTDGEILKGVYRVDIYDPKCTHVNNDDTSTGDGNSGDNLSSGGDLVLMSTDEDGSSTTDVDTLNSTTESSDLLPAITNNDSVLKAYHVEPGHESQLYCDDDGYLIIIGLPSDAEIELTEVTAPDGYNALDGPVKDYKLLKDSDGKYLTADTTSETKPTFWGGTRTYFYIATESLNELKSASANFMVKNYKGTLLPITGGAGVTALYVVGGLLIVGAGTALVVRRRRQS